MSHFIEFAYLAASVLLIAVFSLLITGRMLSMFEPDTKTSKASHLEGAAGANKS
jgi:hypothetical protein